MLLNNFEAIFINLIYKICKHIFLKKALIIGSGIAGIASALRLRKKGYAVTVFEANSYVGGKLTTIKKEGYRWDTGPSLFTMPHLVDELFELYNLNPKEHFQYSKKQNICNYFWEDTTRFTAVADQEKFVSSASSTFNTPAISIEKYLKSAQEKYELSEPIFLKKSLHKLQTYLSKDIIIPLLKSYKLDTVITLNKTNKKYFSNLHLIQLFNRYATYNGSSPFKTPGIMSMIPHLEMHYGTFFPKGGMVSITKSLHSLAKDQGVEFKVNEAVSEIVIEQGKAKKVVTNKGEYAGNIVVSNMDIFSTYQKLLKKEKQPTRILNQERSSSALIFYWGISRTFQELDLHNIFFSDDYQEEFRQLFEEKKFADDLTVYINITSKENSDDAPKDCENWFVMVNAPGDFNQNWEELKVQAKNQILKKLNRILGMDISLFIEVEEVLDPIGIQQKTSSHRGSLYGTSSNSKFAAFLRHPNFSKSIKNLYFCGGSVHPGGGIPLCLMSAKIVSDLTPEA